ncbi:MAG: multicopper oxidase domain-containing protein [Planctomycetales bacterium]|nr:multicopper oxidase domain-containing protein [Planctomycetales bacterium]
MSRRKFLKTSIAFSAAVLAPWSGNVRSVYAAAKSPKLKKFVDPLPIPPVATPDMATYPGSDYYTLSMAQGTHQFHRQLPPTPAWGYGGAGYLGPTIEAQSGVSVFVRYVNNLPVLHPLETSIDWTVPDPLAYGVLPPTRAVPHLHGGFTPPGFDGHPDAWFTSFATDAAYGSHYDTLGGAAMNECIYWYPNAQSATTLWYHDHAFGITRLNVYAGLAGFYLVRDFLDTGLATNPLGLPAGPYEITLVIQDKQFNTNGTLFYPTVGISAVHPVWVPEFFGDTPVVNGKAYPFVNVLPRRYRFRILNGSQARFYNMWLAGPGKGNLPLWQIGADQGFLPAAVPLQTLLIAPGERADVIVDFTGIKPGTSFVLSNNANTPFPGGGKPAGTNIPDIMKFNVIAPPAGTPADTTTLPANLVLPPVAPIFPDAGAPTRQIILGETLDPATLVPIHMRLNERWFDELPDETPKAGAAEMWQFVNLTVDAHPMHMHLVAFQVVSRQAFDVVAFQTAYMAWVAGGRVGAQPDVNFYLLGAVIPALPEELGAKDTVKAFPGEVTRIVARFDLPPGVTGPAEYVYHCHILEHEENEMMRPFVVVPPPPPV